VRSVASPGSRAHQKRATGAAGPYSDNDLLVVMATVEDGRALRAAMELALRDTPVPVDPTVTTPERVVRSGKRVGTILRPAQLEGVTLYARR